MEKNIPRFIGITGLKKSGKTRTIEYLVPALRKMNLKIGTVKVAFKDVSVEVNEEHHDIERHRRVLPEKSLFKSKIETAIFINTKFSLRESLKEFSRNLDLVLIEGFPEDLLGIPQIALIKELNQQKDIVNEFTVAISSIPEFSIKSPHAKYIEFSDLVNVVQKSALPLFPNLNCLHCGYNNCNLLIKEIIAGNKTVNDCEILEQENAKIVVKINDKSLPCNSFVQDIFEKVIMGILSTLKLEEKDLNKVNIEIKHTNKKS
ncbi:MAG: molybdopterin-guanine dinucleotide biosynthesis protein MobB [Candidatus Heimdallarchaeota archaeon]|nr:molybdopterin-guanine dinucleotide biosynthesis protein MobB [Candidatus Heimdallarchaeota archaeon]